MQTIAIAIFPGVQALDVAGPFRASNGMLMVPDRLVGLPGDRYDTILVTAGVERDVLGIAYEEFSGLDRTAVVSPHPRGSRFKENIIQAFYDGMKHRPDSTFGTVNDDVLALKDPTFRRIDFCSVIRGSHWHE